jgi:hypothetical protein
MLIVWLETDVVTIDPCRRQLPQNTFMRRTRERIMARESAVFINSPCYQVSGIPSLISVHRRSGRAGSWITNKCRCKQGGWPTGLTP